MSSPRKKLHFIYRLGIPEEGTSPPRKYSSLKLIVALLIAVALLCLSWGITLVSIYGLLLAITWFYEVLSRTQ